MHLDLTPAGLLAMVTKNCNLCRQRKKMRSYISLLVWLFTLYLVWGMLKASCLTVRCGLGQRGVYGRTLPLFWGKHTPGELFFFLTRQLAASHQLGIKTEAICNQQLLIGGGELMGLRSIIQWLHVSGKRSTTGFSAGERKSYSHLHSQACHYLILGSRERVK